MLLAHYCIKIIVYHTFIAHITHISSFHYYIPSTSLQTKSGIGQDIGHFRGGPSSTGVGFLPNSENIS